MGNSYNQASNQLTTYEHTSSQRSERDEESLESFYKLGDTTKMKSKMRISVVILAALLCVVMAGKVFAQIELPEIQIRTFNSEKFPQVSLVFDLHDNNGAPILDLTLPQVTLQEDGQLREVTTLTNRVNDDLVISLALVIDVSASSEGQPLKNAIQATNYLLNNLNDSDKVAFVAVRPEVSVDLEKLNLEYEVGFTTDHNKIRNVVNFLEIQGEQTALYNAMFKAVKLTAAENRTKRAVIVMTDGRDFSTNSAITNDDPILEANRNGIPIFTIGLGQPRDEQYLQRVAARTGGTFQPTNNPQELGRLFDEVLQSLKQEYILTYQSGLLARDQVEHLLTLSIDTRGTSVSDDLYFNLLSGKFKINLSPTPTLTSTSTPTATSTSIAKTTPTVRVIQQKEVMPPTQVAIVTETVVPTHTPIPSKSLSNSSPSIKAISNTTLQDKSYLDRIRENPLPVIVVVVIILLFMLALIIFMILQKRLKNKQRQRASGFDSDPSIEPSVTKYNLTMEKTELTELKPQKDSDDDLIHPTVKEQSIDSKNPLTENHASQQEANSSDGSLKKKVLSSNSQGTSPRIIQISNEQYFEISNDHFFIGRHPKSDILLMDETVSARHAVIIHSQNKILIQDVGSTNGTFINGEQIEGRRELKDGDNLHFGKVEMIYRAPKDKSEEP